MADSDDVWQVSNEFATVSLCLVKTASGTRVRITSLKLGFHTELDAMALESLTWQPPETYSQFLETPFGEKGVVEDEA